MYRIYMPVDMVLALTHGTMRRERVDRLYRQRLNAASEAKTTYEKLVLANVYELVLIHVWTYLDSGESFSI